MCVFCEASEAYVRTRMGGVLCEPGYLTRHIDKHFNVWEGMFDLYPASARCHACVEVICFVVINMEGTVTIRDILRRTTMGSTVDIEMCADMGFLVVPSPTARSSLWFNDFGLVVTPTLKAIDLAMKMGVCKFTQEQT